MKRYCIRVEPRYEANLLTELARHGTVSGDRCGHVLWADVDLDQKQVESLPGVNKAIAYLAPLWPDLLLKNR